MNIRTASEKDLNEILMLENACFPPEEAASAAELRARLAHYPDHFWLLEEENRIVSMVDGLTTDEADLRDEMYADPRLHRETGRWQMIFGVETDPACRKRGYAGALLRRAAADARAQGRKGLVLTCKEALLPYYARFGFRDEGLSASVHGGAVWHQMRLVF